MDCGYYDRAECRSCTVLLTPYDAQLASKELHAHSLVPAATWLPSVRSAESGFRNKAKMVVAGTAATPTVGILDAQGQGVDLRECGLYPPAIAAALPVLAGFVTLAQLEPYDITARSGELKSIIVTANPHGELMVRWVLRSTESLARIRKHLPALARELPSLQVASVNVLPEHRAVLEGERELALTDRQELTMRVNDIPLALRPQSFFQTNTHVAAALYRQAAVWADAVAPDSVWDLYCGVGGFALHLAAAGRVVVGVESSVQAVASATATAAELARSHVPGAAEVEFVAADAGDYARGADAVPQLVVVNPPRRGIGVELAQWLEASTVQTVIYSSCNSESLARDLERMPSLRPVEACVLDMFPHTEHYEVAVLLQRATA